MATAYERTKSVIETRKFLQMLASADEVTRSRPVSRGMPAQALPVGHRPRGFCRGITKSLGLP
jgi:hypothetical protein